MTTPRMGAKLERVFTLASEDGGERPMIEAQRTRRMPWLRYAFLGTILAVIWLALSLFASATGASADENQPNGQGTGLLGVAGTVVGAVSQTTGAVGDTVGTVVETVVEPVDTVVEPVVEAVPEPIAPVVQPVVEAVPAVTDTATDTANGVVAPANTAVGTVGNSVSAAARDAAGSGAVGTVLHPVGHGVGQVVDTTVGAVPVVGDVVPKGLIGKAVGDVADTADGTLGAVVGSMPPLPTDGSGVLPQLPSVPLLPGGSGEPGTPGFPGIPGLDGSVGAITSAATVSGPPANGLWSLHSNAGSSSTASDVTPLPADVSGAITPADSSNGAAAPGSPAAGGGAGTGGAGSGGAGGASGTSDAAFAALGADALASMVLNSVDDDLPSSPVFDTDTTPD
jgi:hypothetical protein